VVCTECGEIMESIGQNMFHCPRCGVLLNYPADGEVVRPKLVEHCREFSLALYPHQYAEWTEVGIADAIGLPGISAERAEEIEEGIADPETA